MALERELKDGREGPREQDRQWQRQAAQNGAWSTG
jgi:hypothetical protein